MIRDPYASARDRELTKWPGAHAEIVSARRHLKVRISLAGRSRIVITAVSPSDRRGIHNHVAVVRRMLRELTGAVQ